MTVSKIAEVTIFESPDGGRTVYSRNAGSVTRELHRQDPKLQQELKESELQKRWAEIFSLRKHNTELNIMCEKVEILYELSKKST